MVFALAACGNQQTGGDTNTPAPSGSQPVEESQTPATEPAATDIKVAMITDYGDITDQSFNQTTYEACKAYCDPAGIPFEYYKPAGDSTAERVAMVDAAVADGYNVIVMPGYAFAETIKETAELYPDVTFIALDVAQGDLGEDYTVPSNVYCAVYQEELCGYMAGYAAVKLGYTHLGFLGGMAVPAVQRYGYGYIQGADAAAAETGADVTLEYVYGNQFFGDADITAYMDNWYQSLGVEVVFACGGGIYTSAAEAAAKVGGGLLRARRAEPGKQQRIAAKLRPRRGQHPGAVVKNFGAHGANSFAMVCGPAKRRPRKRPPPRRRRYSIQKTGQTQGPSRPGIIRW